MTECFEMSVVTPSFNYCRFLRSALASVEQQQIYVEHVIADGGSEDGTVQLLSKSVRPSLVWISESDRGQSDALNKALRLSSGPLIGWLNADECYLPNALDAVARAFDRPNVNLVTGDVIMIDGDGRFIRLLCGYPFSEIVLRWRGCYLPTASTFARRSCLSPEPWDEQLRVIMDWDYFLKVRASGGTVEYLRRPLAAFRVHPDQVTAVPMSRRSDEHQRVRRRHGLPGVSWSSRAVTSVGDGVHRFNKVRYGARKLEAVAQSLTGALVVDADGQFNASLLQQLDSLYERVGGPW